MRKIVFLLFGFTCFFKTSVLGQDILYYTNFESISDWTVTPGGTNTWTNSSFSEKDSIGSYEGKAIYVKCDTCSANPVMYNITGSPHNVIIQKNTPINIPSHQFSIKFAYVSLVRATDNLYFEYSYNGSTWHGDNLPLQTKWGEYVLRVEDLNVVPPSPFDLYVRFQLRVVGGSAQSRISCMIDDFKVITNQYEIYNKEQTVFVNNGTTLYVKNGGYSDAPVNSEFHNLGTLHVSGNGSLSFNNDYIAGPPTNGTIIFTDDFNNFLNIGKSTNFINNLILNKNYAYQTVVIDTPTQVTTQLTLDKGNITLGARRIYLDLMSSSTPVASDSGFVVGNVTYGLNSPSRLYPVGDKDGNNLYYRPLWLDAGDYKVGVRYKRILGSATYNPYTLENVSDKGYWQLVKGVGTTVPSSPNIEIKFKNPDPNGEPAESLRVALSHISPWEGFYSNNYVTRTLSGTPSDGTLKVHTLPLFNDTLYVRLGFAKDAKYNFTAMLQGPLFPNNYGGEKEKIIFYDGDFFNTDWTVSSSGTMTWQTEADRRHVRIYSPSRKALDHFEGLALINSFTNKNVWVTSGSGSADVKMNNDIPAGYFNSSKTYYLRFEYMADMNANNYFFLMYSLNSGVSWTSLLPLPSTNHLWNTYTIEINATNFPGFVKGSSTIRFGFAGVYGSTHITDPNIPAPLIDNLRVVEMNPATNPATEMASDIYFSYLLDSLVAKSDLPGIIPAPQRAVDLITVQIRDNQTSSYTVLEEQKAWLMYDGTIRGLDGAPYLTFVKNNSMSGFLVIKHRNHLPIMSANSINISTTLGPTLDMTDIANIMDGTAFQYTSSPDKYAMYMGNATDDFSLGDYYETNASDYFIVSSQNGTGEGYVREDLDLDGFVNSQDFDLVQVGNNNLYFSTVPEP